jgi:hypothetical protein
MEGRIINVRKLVSLDISLHGPKFIIVEFGVGTPAIIAFGLFLMFFTGPFLLGLYLLMTGFNYVPLLIYAVIAVRRGSAKDDVKDELAADPHYVRKYSVQQLLIFIPLAIVILGIGQRLTSNSS